MSDSTLDPAILGLVERPPIEDLLLHLLPSKLPGVEVRTRIRSDQTFPLVLMRNDWTPTQQIADSKLLDAVSMTFHVYCDGLNAELDAQLLSEALRVTLLDQLNVVVEGRGHIAHIEMTSRPRRVTDWATATGPVQYADLPEGVERYESRYDITIKKPAAAPELYPS